MFNIAAGTSDKLSTHNFTFKLNFLIINLQGYSYSLCLK